MVKKRRPHNRIDRGFENLYRKKSTAGLETSVRESLKWFRQNMHKMTVSERDLMMENKDSMVNSWTNTGLGSMYFYNYDPKHKKTLPYYDIFPLVIVIEKYKDGFLGLNLHYLPPLLRAKLMDGLLDIAKNERNPDQRIAASYGLLKSAAKLKYYKPTIKRYLGKHFRSRLLKVPPDYWEMAVFLPVSNFKKASRQEVWSKSRNAI